MMEDFSSIIVVCPKQKCKQAYIVQTATLNTNNNLGIHQLPPCTKCSEMPYRCNHCPRTCAYRRKHVLIRHVMDCHQTDVEGSDTINDDGEDAIAADDHVNNLSMEMSHISMSESHNMSMSVQSTLNDASFDAGGGLNESTFAEEGGEIINEDDVGEILSDDEQSCCYDYVDGDDTDASEEDVESLYEEVLPHDDCAVSNDDEHIDLSYMNGAANQRFYTDEHNTTNGGMRGLVHRAANRYKDMRGYAEHDVSEVMTNITNNLFTKPKSQQQEYLSSLKGIFSLYGHAPNISVTIPTDMKSANDTCLQNRYSIIANMPHPEPFMYDGHACIKLKDLIHHLMAAGVEMSFMRDHKGNVNKDGLNGTPAVTGDDGLLSGMDRDMGEESTGTACGYVILWSDSFLRCFSRQRENGVWLLIVQVCPPNDKSATNAYCLAFGRSKRDHSKVVELYIKELETIRLGQKMYYGHPEVRRTIGVAFDLLLYIADTPERNGLLGTMNLGLYGLRSLWAGIVDTKLLPSCDRCFLALVRSAMGTDRDTAVSACRTCYNWDNYDNEAIKYDKTANTKYPKKSSQENQIDPPLHRDAGETFLRPVKQEFDWLVSAVSYAWYEMTEGKWTKTGASSYSRYLQTCAISQKIQDKLSKLAESPEGKSAIQAMPYLWLSRYKINIFVDTPMHLIGHGIIGTMIELTESVLTEHKLWTKFKEFANPILSDVEKQRLDWLKVKTLPKKNWLAEDCFGYGRLMLHIYGEFLDEYDLTAYRYPQTLPEIVVCLKEMILSMHVMIGLIFDADYDSDLDNLSTHIKIFLSCCHRFCKAYYDPRVSEFWASKGNFISLLNLVEQIALFGNIRRYWDGKFESFLQGPKRELKNIRRSDISFIGPMRVLHKRTVLERLRKLFRKTDGESDDIKHRQVVRIYKSEADVLGRFNSGLSISGFIGKNQKVYVPCSVGKQDCTFVVLEYQYSGGSSGCGLPNAKFSVAKMDSAPVKRKTSVKDMKADFCLLLGSSNGGGDHTYAIITDLRKQLCLNGNIEGGTLHNTVNLFVV